MPEIPDTTDKVSAAPNHIVLLPDSVFFIRTVAVAEGATAVEVADQAELTLESLSPFPPSQLYHGHYWSAGERHVLVFGAYRRRFTGEQLEAWENADLVLPSFAALLGAPVGPGVWLLHSPEGLTAIQWATGRVPAAIACRPCPADAVESDRMLARAAVLEEVGGGEITRELETPVFAGGSHNERQYVFRSGEVVSRLTGGQAGALDVRDKDALAALRRSRARDLLVWRLFIGSVAALLVLGLGELALLGGGAWQRLRTTQITAQRPVVEKIMTAQNLANRIDELSTKRLLPFEMIALVSAAKPASVQFLRTTTSGLHTLLVEAQTGNAADVGAYQSALAQNPACAKVEVRDPRTRDNLATFTLAVTFKPEALKAGIPTP